MALPCREVQPLSPTQAPPTFYLRSPWLHLSSLPKLSPLCLEALWPLTSLKATLNPINSRVSFVA